jgi:lipooligosaccharide transport system permease protein
MIARAYALPDVSLRFLPVWRRNFLVWRKLWLPSILGNLADPMIYMLGLGYGLGSLLPAVGGVPYIMFLAAGTVAFSTMNSATFETLYSGFSRMHVQKTWDAILNAPVNLDDVVLAELAWATTKAMLSGTAILLVAWALGAATMPAALGVLLVLPLVGLAFGALGLVVCALSPSFDFFMYYFTLVVTPMAMLSGVFYPMDPLPQALRVFAQVLPLTHAVALVRPLVQGEAPTQVVVHVAVLLGYAAVAFYAATVLFRRRLLK